jgi:hypothetical protein
MLWGFMSSPNGDLSKEREHYYKKCDCSPTVDWPYFSLLEPYQEDRTYVR